MPHRAFALFILPSLLAMLLFIALPLVSVVVQSLSVAHAQVPVAQETCDPFGCKTETRVDAAAMEHLNAAAPQGRFNGLGTYLDQTHLAVTELRVIWADAPDLRTGLSQTLNLPITLWLLHSFLLTVPRDLDEAALTDAQMPRDFAVSLAAYAKGGTDGFLRRAPDHLPRQVMTGFDPAYVDIIDDIVRIAHRIWEEKDIGHIYHTCSHDCRVWDDVGLQDGRDKIVADTVHTNAAIPDIRLVAEMSTGRAFHDLGQLRAHVLTTLAMFPNLAMRVEDVCWMGDPRGQCLVAVR